ncbi:MAG: hypothetical protein ACRDQZ_26385 [Mycobacteriales bacterium]
MPPKTPKQLLDQLLKRNNDRPADDHSMTTEGMKAPNPSRDEFLANLEKASEPRDLGSD